MGSQIGFEKLASVSWYYVASLLIIGLYFKFNRFWSVRNLDLILIVLLAPGALMVTHGQKMRAEYYDNYVDHMADHDSQADDARQTSINDPSGSLLASPKNGNETQNPTDDQKSKSGDSNSQKSDQAEQDKTETPPSRVPETFDRAKMLVELRQQRPADSPFMEDPEFAFNVRLERNGYLWLFGFGLLLLVRVLMDPGFRRRPMLESNLSVGGLVFLGCSLLAFVIIDVAQSQPVSDSTDGAKHMVKIVNRTAVDGEEGEIYYQHGPGFALMHIFPAIPTFVSASGEFKVPESESDAGTGRQLEITTKILAIVSLLGIVAGIVLIGYWHFGNFHLGVTVATLYLMLPFTADTAGLVFHVLPALLIVWAIVMYKRPYLSGFLVGLAAGVFYYPLFLLPLWFSFYWERGRVRFLLGFLVSVLLVIGSLIFVSRDFAHFTYHLQRIFGFWLPKVVGVRGIWAVGWDPWFRLPLLAGFFGLSFSFALWPIRKDLGVLVSCTAAVLMALQFCHGFGGGMYIAWYLPLFLLTVFRPNLEDRVAINDINEKWFMKNLAVTK